MVNGSGRSVAPFDVPGFPTRLRAWLEEHRGVLSGLVDLRTMGPDAEEAVSAILNVRPLVTVRIAWELWESLLEGDGDDSEIVLLHHMPFSLFAEARLAFWGADPETTRAGIVARR